MNKNIKAVVCDIDLTLVQKGGNLMPLTKQALEELHARGVMIGLASGRPVDWRMAKNAEKWGLNFEFDFLIGMNGGELWDKNHEGITPFHILSRETLTDICTMIKPLVDEGTIYNGRVYEGDSMCCLHVDDFMIASSERNDQPMIDAHDDLYRLAIRDTFKMMFFYKWPEDNKKVYDYLAQHEDPRWQCFDTVHGSLEICDPHINKGTAVVAFAERNGIAIDEVVAFGDMDNDNEMLKAAGWGVCLKNGGERTKACADAITEYDVDNDGVGHYLYDHGYFD